MVLLSAGIAILEAMNSSRKNKINRFIACKDTKTHFYLQDSMNIVNISTA
jgi:hypothetical protein